MLRPLRGIEPRGSFLSFFYGLFLKQGLIQAPWGTLPSVLCWV